MGMIKSYYHDEICALKESDDSFSRDYKVEKERLHQTYDRLKEPRSSLDELIGDAHDRIS